MSMKLLQARVVFIMQDMFLTQNFSFRLQSRKIPETVVTQTPAPPLVLVQFVLPNIHTASCAEWTVVVDPPDSSPAKTWTRKGKPQSSGNRIEQGFRASEETVHSLFEFMLLGAPGIATMSKDATSRNALAFFLPSSISSLPLFGLGACRIAPQFLEQRPLHHAEKCIARLTSDSNRNIGLVTC